MDNEFPAIFYPSKIGVPIAYFNGPWLPMSKVDEFVNYSFNLNYPLQVLEFPEKRAQIINGIEKLLPNVQLNLFSSLETKLNNLFNQFLDLSKNKEALYSQWTQNINGKSRNLVKAKKCLDVFLRNYVKEIIMQAPCHSQCHGGEKDWSVEKSLKTHTPLGSVLSFDLENTFNRISHQYVFDFYYNFFKSKFEDKEVRKNLAGFLTHVSTVYNKDMQESVLPQGSPISMSLFNRLFYPIDELFDEKSKKRNLRYTRWVDDMIISASEGNRNFNKFGGALRIVREDFPISLNKVFWQENVPEYYLLGHKILGKRIIKINKEELKNRGEPIPTDLFLNELEEEHNWIEEEDCGARLETF